ncbi:MAG TPA: hypothetical protein VK208_12550 [Pyrinomonadaceae bacterium]|nr:hypothetical protein [Pyrinomonadaceae bacterium]
MSELFLEKADTRKLAHAYVALALAQDVAKRDLNDSAAATRPLLSILEMTADLLEEVLQKALPEECSEAPEPIWNADMIM